MCGVSVMASPETNVTSVVVREFVYVYAEYACVVGSRFFSLSLSRDLCHFSDREMSTSSGLSAFSNARRYRFMGEERERERRRTLDCILRIESLILKRFSLQFMAPSSRISSREKFINGQFPNECTDEKLGLSRFFLILIICKSKLGLPAPINLKCCKIRSVFALERKETLSFSL